MNSEGAFLAFDMGAESGRALIGRFESGTLTVEEIHRFPNEPVSYNGELHWDAPRLWLEMRKGLARAAALEGMNLKSLGVDAWGVDYALLGESGVLLENPYHYRDRRTEGMMERVFARVPKDEIYLRTGTAFMPIYTLYQLYAASLKTPKLLGAVESLVTIPGLFNYWLTGRSVCEFTSATTTQFYDPRRRDWATELLDKLGLPSRILTPVIQPGTVIGPLLGSVANSAGMPDIPVVAPACHDTASAVSAIASTGESVFISSGTWSLLGTEISEAIINREAQHLDMTNEGGVCGTFQLLKLMTGLWLLQRCRRDWQVEGEELTYEQLTDLARSSPPFRGLVNPDHPCFMHPESMPEAIAQFCVATEQPVPPNRAAFARAVLDSLAFKYRLVLESLEGLTGKRYEEIHIVGGGAKNQVLNQFVAEATGRRVFAGPVEATALGNIGMQMLATETVTSLAEVRQVIARSFPTRMYEPIEPEKWEKVYKRFKQYCLAPVPFQIQA